ncbi:ketoacyl-ACP synthase III [soil metagenome]
MLEAPRARPGVAADAPLVRGAAVGSVGMAVPVQVIPNATVAERLGVADSWIESRTGVRERRRASGGETLTSLAVAAAERTLTKAGIEGSDLDCVIVATTTADQRMPNAAPLVAAQIGSKSASSFDVGTACTGFVSALSVAAGQVESGRAGSVLVIGAELLSRVTDPDDKRTAGLFGDGAGAVLVTATEGAGRIGPVPLSSDGDFARLVQIPEADGVIRMDGPDTYREAVARLTEVTLEATAASGRSLIEIDLFVYHQANSRILRAVGERLGLDPQRVVDTVPTYGNTSAASIPIALAVAEEEGRLVDGSTVLIAAFGAGLTWGAATIEWGSADA